MVPSLNQLDGKINSESDFEEIPLKNSIKNPYKGNLPKCRIEKVKKKVFD